MTGPWIDNLATLAIVSAIGLFVARSKRQPLWAEAYRRLARNRLAKSALVAICLYGLVGLLDSLCFTDPATHQPRSVLDKLFDRPLEATYSAPLASTTIAEAHPRRLNAPRGHLLGTNGVGEDVLYKTLKGCRTALIIGGLTSIIAVPLALLLGLSAGFFGKLTDDAVQYTYTVFASVPDILLLIALVLVLGRGLPQICLALGVTSWVPLCRLVRGETLKHRDREYVRAARALGAGNARLLVRHILPNLLPVVMISALLGFSSFILYEAILSYLGVGVGEDVGSWGNMIDSARTELSRDPVIWWNLVPATVALFGLVLSLNIFGDALRDAIDPRLRSS
jgi:peptide/nickel transport system permease protein